MHRILFAKWKHSAGRFLILFLVLCLASSFWSVSLQLYLQSVRSARYIEENTTTVALMEDTYSTVEENGIPVVVRDDFPPAVRMKLNKSPAVRGNNISRTFGAVADNIKPVLLTLEERALEAPACTHPGTGMGVFRIRYNGLIRSAEVGQRNGYSFTDENGEQKTADCVMRMYYGSAALLEVLESNESFYFPEEVGISFDLANEDGSLIFEVGKEYVVYGLYLGGPVFKMTNKMGKVYYSQTLELPEPAHSIYVSAQDDLYGSEVLVQDEHGIYEMRRLQPENAPCVLSADDPRIGDMIALAQHNNRMLNVTGVELIDGIPLFAMKEADLVEGRTFNAGENREGARVCVVSGRFAAANDLAIGDSISMELYEADYGNVPEARRKIQADMQGAVAKAQYEIIGLYDAMPYAPIRYYIDPNTIFVPIQSLPDGGFEGIGYANSMVLKNGANERFVEDAVKAGMKENSFVIYDGGYPQFMRSLEIMRRDTGVVFAVCMMLFFVLTVSALGMMVHHLWQDADVMMKVGADRRYALRYICLCVLPAVVISALTAYWMTCLAYEPMMLTMEKLYTLDRPIYSNLPAGSSGMLSSAMTPYPSVLGAVTAFAGGVMAAAGILRLRRERRAT